MMAGRGLDLLAAALLALAFGWIAQAIALSLSLPAGAAPW